MKTRGGMPGRRRGPGGGRRAGKGRLCLRELQRTSWHGKHPDLARVLEAVGQALHFFTTFTEANPEWRQVAASPITTELGDIRSQYLSFSASGLLIMAEVGNEILQLPNNVELIGKLAALDWSRSAAMWQGNVIVHQNGKKGPRMVVASQRVPIATACNKVRAAIGLPVK
jgi:hypothetical protein